GYMFYPKNPAKSWTKDPPGLGSKIVSYTNAGAPLAPTPLGNNPAWQEVNKELNASVDFQIISQADYPAKLATMMAGNDLTDYVLIGLNVQNLTAFLEARAADLTPYLAGDKIKDYPNLAALPPYSWTNPACARDGKLYMFPIARAYPGNMMWYNATIWDAEIGKDYQPKDSDDLMRIFTALNKPSSNRWAFGSFLNRTDQFLYFASMFGAPQTWRLESDGKLTRDIETPEFKAGIAYANQIVKAGMTVPDASANVTAARDPWIAGKFVVDTQTFGNAWQDAWFRGQSQKPTAIPHAVTPFAADGKSKPVHYVGRGYYSTTMLKQAPADRIKELLRVADFLAAPFGSAEDLLLTTGVKDRDYSLDTEGNVTPTPQSNQDANSVPWKYVTQHPYIAFWAGVPDYAKAATDYEKVAIPAGVQDPTIGLATPTLDKQGTPLLNNLNSALTDMVVGRRPMSDYDQVVKDWQNGGGNQIRTELQQALAAAKG
ncbi:MAG TPA: hypothetical protein VFS62_14120, partial [Chloroflexota bacterium]|nr:hypothetical protein [Chloroflexota bacterium]